MARHDLVRTPVYLNVYDVSPVNEYGLYVIGLGAHHSGVEVGGTEFAYGGHDSDATGVYDHAPRALPELAAQQGQQVTFRETILVGYTRLSMSETRSVVDRLRSEFIGKDYSLLSWNCNHFSDRMCQELLNGKGIPTWVNRLAWLGAQFACFLPASMGGVPSDTMVSEHTALFPGSGQSLSQEGASSADVDRAAMAAAADRRMRH